MTAGLVKRVKGYAYYNVGNSAVWLADTPDAGDVVPDDAIGMDMIVEGSDAIRWRPDGTEVTEDEGVYMEGGSSMSYDLELQKFSMIRDAAASNNVPVRLLYWSI